MNSRDISPLPLPVSLFSFGNRLKRAADGSLQLGWGWGAIIFFAMAIPGALATSGYAFYARQYQLLWFGAPVLLFALFCIRRSRVVRLDPLAGELKIDGEVFPFDQIAALQVTPGLSTHQLNMVTVYGARYNLVPGGSAGTIRTLAQEIAAVIGGIPVFDRELEVEPVASDGVIRAENLVWTPVAPGGTNQRTHRLVPTPGSGYTFKPSFGITGTLVLIPFFLSGAIGPWVGLWMLVTGRWVECLFFLLWSALFGLPLWWYFYLRSKQPFFDPMERMFYRGRRHRDPVPLDEIVALQILTETCRGSKGGSYESYELNLVLKDNRRLNVIDHGDLKQLRSDAETLAKFLKVPLVER